MAIYQIGNGKLAVEVDSRGAELKSLRRISDGVEYLWYGDEAYWARRSPLLFPAIGGLKNGEYRFKGQTYHLERHGFIKDTECKLISQTDTEIWFVAEADEASKKLYPFDFRLEIGYRLEGMALKVMWKVENPSEEPLYFSIGGHPGFNCPLKEGEKQESYYMAFDVKDSLQSTVIDPDGFAADHAVTYPLEDGRTAIKKELFEYSTLVMENSQIHKVSLLTPDKKPYITVELDAPVLAIWTPIEKQAPFICIEPWYGLCDLSDFNGTWEEKKWSNALEPGAEFAAGYCITIEE